MRWYVNFNKLSPRQRKILDDVAKDPVNAHWIQGFAGTGKTLLLAHLIERLTADNPTTSLCFITYTKALVELVRSGIPANKGKRAEIRTHTDFLSRNKIYDCVVLDEVQDISATDLVRIKNLAKRIVVAGDPDQQIYEGRASGDEIRNLLHPIEHNLFEIFRLTEKLCKVAMSILPTAKVVEGNPALNMVETSIRQIHYSDNSSQSKHVWEEAKNRASHGDPSVILFPRHHLIYSFSEEVAEYENISNAPPFPEPQENGPRDYDPFNRYWEKNNVGLVYLGNGYGTLPISDSKPIVYIMTFHSSKGLDFENVIIPGMDSGMQIMSRYRLESDPNAEKRLLFVAVTRSRENLFFSYCGQPSSYLDKLPRDVVVKVDWDVSDTFTNDDDDDEGSLF